MSRAFHRRNDRGDNKDANGRDKPGHDEFN